MNAKSRVVLKSSVFGCDCDHLQKTVLEKWKMAKVGHILQRGPHRVDWVCAGRAYDHLQKTVGKGNIPHNGRLRTVLRRP